MVMDTIRAIAVATLILVALVTTSRAPEGRSGQICAAVIGLEALIIGASALALGS